MSTADSSRHPAAAAGWVRNDTSFGGGAGEVGGGGAEAGGDFGVVRQNPFKLGDKVVFSPTEHDIGWTWSSFDRLRIHPGDIGVVTRIEKDAYIYLDDDRGGFHWECFRKAP